MDPNFDIFEAHLPLKHKAKEIRTDAGSTVQAELDALRNKEITLYWLDPVDTYADLPTEGNKYGDVRLTRDNNHQYVWKLTNPRWKAEWWSGTTQIPQRAPDKITYPDKISFVEPTLSQHVGYSNRFCGRIHGYVVPEYDEAYTFSVTVDDGIRLYFEDQLVIDKLSSGETFTYTTPVLTKGKAYKIVLEYYENLGFATLDFKWQSPSQSIRPVEAVFHSKPRWEPIQTELALLSDVKLVNPATGHILSFNGDQWVNVEPTLNSLFDVEIGASAVRQLLRYNGTKWINVTDVPIHHDYVTSLRGQYLYASYNSAPEPIPDMRTVVYTTGSAVTVSWKATLTGGSSLVDSCSVNIHIFVDGVSKASKSYIFGKTVTSQIGEDSITIDLPEGKHTFELRIANLTTPYISQGVIETYLSSDRVLIVDEVAGAATLDQLADVTISNGKQGDILKHNGTNWINKPHILDEINDVTLNTPTSRDSLRYISSQYGWGNSTDYTVDNVFLRGFQAGYSNHFDNVYHPVDDLVAYVYTTSPELQIQWSLPLIGGGENHDNTTVVGLFVDDNLVAGTEQSHLFRNVSGHQGVTVIYPFTYGKTVTLNLPPGLHKIEIRAKTYSYSWTGTKVPTVAYGPATDRFLLVKATFSGDLDSLSDVKLTNPQMGQILRYDGTNWVNAAAPLAVTDGNPLLIKYDPSDTTDFSTKSNAFVDVPGMSIAVNLTKTTRLSISWFVNAVSSLSIPCEAVLNINGVFHQLQSTGASPGVEKMGSTLRTILGSTGTFDLAPGLHTVKIQVRSTDETQANNLTILGEQRGLEVVELPTGHIPGLVRPTVKAAVTTSTPQVIKTEEYTPMQDMVAQIFTEVTILHIRWDALITQNLAHRFTVAVFIDGVLVEGSQRTYGLDSKNALLAGPFFHSATGFVEAEVEAGNHTIEIRWYNEEGFESSTVGLSRSLIVEDFGGRIGSFFLG